MDELFSVDAMADPARRRTLPAPGERLRLRLESELSEYQVASACSVTEATIRAWEGGITTPRGDNAEIYRHLLNGLQARLTQTPMVQPPAAAAPDWAALGGIHREIPSRADTDEPCRRCQQPTVQRVGGKPQHLGTRCPTPTAAALPASPPLPAPAPARASGVPARLPGPPAARLSYPAAGRRMTAGPLAVFEAGPGPGLTAHLGDGRTLTCPADSFAGLLAWAVTAGLGAPAVKPGAGLNLGPLLVLTEAAAARLALPLTPPTPAQRHPRSDHQLLEQLRMIGWQTDVQGLGPWTTLHPSGADPIRDGVHLAVTAWGALHRDDWKLPERFDAGQLARLLGQYTALLRTPLGPPGACGHRLMSDLRPPPRHHAVTGARLCPGAPGALTERVDPAPCEAPPGHRLASGRAAADALAVEDLTWWRTPTGAETECAYVVCLAVNLPYVADSNNVRVAASSAHEVGMPAFDRKIPGSWLVDLTPARQHPQMPPAFPGHGLAWHPTAAVAYAQERGTVIQPLKGWLRAGPAGPYLSPWYDRIRLAHLSVLERLGITAGMEPDALLAALRDLPAGDPVEVALLRAVHASAREGTAMLAQQPVDPDRDPALPWPTPADPSWRPDLLAALTANARANVHRKLCLTARTGHFPLAVDDEYIVYATRTPGILEITGDERCGFRVGISPGHVRPVASRSMDWFLDHCSRGENPARLLKNASLAW